MTLKADLAEALTRNDELALRCYEQRRQIIALREALKAVMAEELIYTGAIYETLESSGLHVALRDRIRAALDGPPPRQLHAPNERSQTEYQTWPSGQEEK